MSRRPLSSHHHCPSSTPCSAVEKRSALENLDLVLLAELCTRIELRRDGERAFHGLHPVSALLSYLTKAPLVPAGTPVVNALPKQRAMLENVLRACVGLPPENSMMLEHK